MKQLTIEQAAVEYAESLEDNDYTIETEAAFRAGAEFAQKMTSFDKEKPPYYEPVIIEYNELHIIAWLAWSEEWGYVWTVNGTDVWLEHKPNIKWRTILVK